MKFYGQHDPPLDKLIFERYFTAEARGYKDGMLLGGFFIEAGAIDGREISTCRFFEEELDWNGINVEPVPAIFAALQMNRPRCKNLQVALGNRNGRALFTQALIPQYGERSGNGSLLHDAEHLQQLIDMGCSFEAYPVPVMTYRLLVKLLALRRVDLMVLDVEGAELQVVEGMANADVYPEVLVIENNHADMPAIERWCESFGYEKDIELHNNTGFVRG